jgi:hypothetical protein
MPGTEQLRKEWAAYAKLGRAHITPEYLTGLFVDQLIRLFVMKRGAVCC